ncbi:HAD family hydrolase [Mycoplasma sp. CSL7475-4]|uniref:HAD family hydrolase n=1 Tax=Mycoplasma sp. CSL7475-4 TaxID=2973942 RepID=UPI00216B1DBF|nr:HAD family hydrolase [Mycoplasma sp. CSL7475-4]MCS4537040.1 HAD family hydrolase [Mycoplasma sp. CSL7475-4]
MKKIFAYDLDGTLFVKDNSMHADTPEALAKVQKSGHYNVISTGRALNNIIQALGDKINLFEYILGSNGSILYEVKTGQVRIFAKVNLDAFDLALQTTKDSDFLLRVDTPTNSLWYINNLSSAKWVDKQNRMDLAKVLNLATLEQTQNFAKQNKDNIIQIALRGDKTEIYQVYEKYQSLIGANYEVKYTNEVYIDINGLNNNKWSGLKQVAELAKIDIANIVTFGDSGNDVEMLKNAGLGIAMGNGTFEAKSAAKKIIGANDTNAIATTITELI